MPASPLSPSQLAEAKALKSLFKQWQAERKDTRQPWSQDWASEQLGFGQSAVTQYLNGRIPLNPEAATKFAKLLGCEVLDFSASVAMEIEEMKGHARPAVPDPKVDRDSQISYIQPATGGSVFLRLGALLAPLDGTDREMARTLLNALVNSPESAPDMASRFERLLGDQETKQVKARTGNGR